MADHDDWTADDDARLRAALGSLRTEVESTPLPDVRFVRARGRVLRRRRFLAVGAAAAAAAVVAGTIGYAAWNPAGDIVHLPAGRTTSTAPVTTTPSPTISSALDKPGILPLAEEWESSLRLPAGSVRIVQATTLEGGVECADPMGKPTLQQSVTQAGSPVSAAATYWRTGGDKGKVHSLEQAVLTCQAGPGFVVSSEHLGTWALYSYSAGSAGSGWFAVVPGDDGVELLQLIDPAHPDVKSGGFTKDQLGALAELAQMRLGVYATSPLPTELTSPTGGSTKASEKMTVTGPDPVPPPSLFVPPSQWKNPLLAKGAPTTSGPGALEGSTAIVGCEDDTQQAGIAGRVGVVSIRVGTGTQSYIGNQRVRVFDDVDAVSLVTADLARTHDLLMKGCQTPGGASTTAQAGPTPGTYLLTTKTGGQVLRQWVGVAAMRTAGAVTTITFHSADGGPGFTGTADQGFALLDRLLALARTK